MLVDFQRVYTSRRAEIARLSRTQRVPGHDPDDVASELTIALWKACSTFDPAIGLTLGQWWWSIWTNRKADLIDRYMAAKRVNPVPMDADEITALVEALTPLADRADFPGCPSNDPVERWIWRLIGLGYEYQEIQRMTKTNVYRFYKIIESWRTPQIKGALL